jgi:hypothetical protein
MLQRIVVTGEGPTDIGVSINTEFVAHDNNFEQGPMFVVIEKILHQHLPDWNKEALTVKTFVYRKQLGIYLKENRSTIKLPSKNKANKGHLEHVKGAYALGRIAKDLMVDGQESIAIYFHDTDGTLSELTKEPRRQENRVQAISEGFIAADHKAGVAMVPKPTSEAWFICSCKENSPYQFCHNLETELSGNQKCSNHRSPKIRLASEMNAERTTRYNLLPLARNLDVTDMDMPSFNQFRNDMKQAIRNICGECEE